MRAGGEKVLSSPKLESVFGEVQKAIHGLREGSPGSKVVLVVDQLDLLLATGGEEVGAVGLGELLMGLREVCGTFHRDMCNLANKLPRRYTRLSFLSQRIYHL